MQSFDDVGGAQSTRRLTLREAREGEQARTGKSKNEVTNNALMDAFCTNARALLEFFEKEHKRKAYTDNNYIAFSDQQAAKKFRKRLNRQVAHLIYGGRYTDPVAKINGRERLPNLQTIADRYRDIQRSSER